MLYWCVIAGVFCHIKWMGCIACRGSGTSPEALQCLCDPGWADVHSRRLSGGKPWKSHGKTLEHHQEMMGLLGKRNWLSLGSSIIPYIAGLSHVITLCTYPLLSDIKWDDPPSDLKHPLSMVPKWFHPLHPPWFRTGVSLGNLGMFCLEQVPGEGKIAIYSIVLVGWPPMGIYFGRKIMQGT